MELIINCEDRWRKAVEVVRDTNDNTLSQCLFRLMAWHGVAKVVLSGDFAEHSFLFSTYRADGTPYICGGLIYHGSPLTGYREAGSVQIHPSYGWQIHT